ncbi:MAG: hypothetical protein KDD49_10290, partial [Bacteroidetes bacterium]|nr:hypothetical protein [Bacteroidota bacterium]
SDVSSGGTTTTAISGTYPFTDVTTTSGTTDPTAVPVSTGLTFGSFTAVGTPANPNASGRFSFTDWSLGATNGSDVFTGGINTSEYYQVTLTPDAGCTIDLNTLTFTLQRSGTGIRQYAVRSSLDGYAANLPASISPANTNLSVVTTNVFQVSDAVTSAQTGSTVTLNSSYDAISSPVTFRFYGFNAEGNGGAFSIDNVVFTGSTTCTIGVVCEDTFIFTEPDCSICTNPPTVAAEGPYTTCVGDAVLLSDAAFGGSATMAQWSITNASGGATIADGSLSNTAMTNDPASVTFTATVAGSYELTLTSDNPLGAPCVAATSITSVNVSAYDVVTLSYPQAAYCTTDADPSPTVTGGAADDQFSAPAGLIIDAGTGVIDVSASTPGTYTVTYRSSLTSSCPGFDTFDITINTADVATLSYAQTAYCTTDTDPSPTVTGGAADDEFTASPAGLVIDANTGVIDVSASTPATYTITYTTSTGTNPCPDTETFDITINQTPDLSVTSPITNTCPSTTVDLTNTTITGLTDNNGTSGSISYHTTASPADASDQIVPDETIAATGTTYYIRKETAEGCVDIVPIVVNAVACDQCSTTNTVNGTPTSVCVLNTEISDWKTNVTNNAINTDGSGASTTSIVYSSVGTYTSADLPTSTWAAEPSGAHSGSGCSNEIQNWYAYVLCDLDGNAGTTNDISVTMVGSIAITFYPPAQVPTIVRNDETCTYSYQPACSGDTFNPATISNANAGDDPAAFNVMVTTTNSCTANFSVDPEACPALVCSQTITTTINEATYTCDGGSIAAIDLDAVAATLQCSGDCSTFTIEWFTDAAFTTPYNNDAIAYPVGGDGCSTSSVMLYAKATCSEDNSELSAGTLTVNVYPAINYSIINADCQPEIAVPCGYSVTYAISSDGSINDQLGSGYVCPNAAPSETGTVTFTITDANRPLSCKTISLPFSCGNPCNANTGTWGN